ncbi:MAG: HAD-IA family hydrolase [Gammaproteobacteria bacterium]|jgi:HAD superfamily hydrolase (TIGR01509 family)|nr:HAD-IA family hydrolase [Gammaproteobacteria bacterium]
MARIDLVIFDCDGVLVDSEPLSLRCLVDALGRIGERIDPETAQERFLGISTASMCAQLEAERGAPLPEGFLDDLRRSVFNAFAAELVPVDGITRLIDRLSVRRCVASSSTPERIRHALRVTGLIGRLEPHLYSATMVARGKPAPDLFLHAARGMGIDPASCVVVEDSVAGVTAAAAAGMTVIGFTGGSHLDHATHGPALAEAGAGFVCPSSGVLELRLAQLGAIGAVPAGRATG